jgi:hypothetical protein
MNCPDSEALIQRRLDGEVLPNSADLERHFAECAECRERALAASQMLEVVLPVLRRPTLPPADWTAATVADLLDDHIRRRRRFYRRAGLATAASLVLALLAGGYVYQQWLSSVPAQDTRAHNPDAPAEIKDKGGEPSLAQTVADAETAVKSLSNRIAEQTVDQMRTLVSVSAPSEVGPMPTLPTVATIEQPLDPATRSLQETGRGVSTGIQTVANSARRAFDFLLRELPPVAR